MQFYSSVPNRVSPEEQAMASGYGGYIGPGDPSAAHPPPIGFEMQPTGGPAYPPQPLGFEGIAPPSSDQLYPEVPEPSPAGTPGEVPQPATPNDVQMRDNESPNLNTPKDSAERVSETSTAGDDQSERKLLAGPKVTDMEGQNGHERRSASDLVAPGGVGSDPSQAGNGTYKQSKDSLFFRDNKRRIDYVLAYEKNDDSKSEEKKQQKRECYEENLRYEGLELEYEDRELSQDGKTFYVKVHAPFDVLCKYAELLCIKMPIAYNDLEDEDDGRQCPNPMRLEIEDDDDRDVFTAPFMRNRMKKFMIPPNKEDFFHHAVRSRIVYTILERCRYEDDKRKIGIKKMLNNGSYLAAYPLHDGPYKSEHSKLTHGYKNDRHLLFEEWARLGKWYKYQPLDKIRQYFGEKIGLYFAWLGFYTNTLIAPAIVGFICILYGAISLGEDVTSQEICGSNITMCPLCDQRCRYWSLANQCRYSQASHVIDNPATVFFAIFMALWATMFLEFWKRKQAVISYDWDLVGFEDEEERPRPEFESKVSTHRINPVNKLEEAFLPFYNKVPRLIWAGLVVVFMVSLVLAAVFAVIVYRIVIVVVFYRSDLGLISERAKLATSATAALLNLIAIMILNKIYERVCYWLTDMELPRTQTEYEDSFTFKMFLFQSVNYYASIFYIAFFKGSFVGRPGDYNYFLNEYRPDECDVGGCLIDLCLQLAIIMVGKQAYNNFMELIFPKLKNWWSRRGNIDQDDVPEQAYTRWEQDCDLVPVPVMALFPEYLEMVIQFGFVTLFVAAFPLAPFFALINNILEIRLDAYKFVTQYRRPMAARAQDIGVWYNILEVLAKVAVVSNAFVIGYTSNFIPRLVYLYGYSPEPGVSMSGYVEDSLSYFNHIVFLIKNMLAYLIPDVPHDLHDLIKREQYLTTEMFFSNEKDLQQSTDNLRDTDGTRQRQAYHHE
ncbi:PREDICTED: anoctamin-4-like [Branchiostoma belcheri]|uniref:Anoctamin n=1 Tax=Branchiostoma belcheri TaxID=7741 RepID=A0A6P5A4K2_BRABE|nr:PREDICTED: anoctamin-4-like [Branchiostoma belcheri]